MECVWESSHKVGSKVPGTISLSLAWALRVVLWTWNRLHEIEIRACKRQCASNIRNYVRQILNLEYFNITLRQKLHQIRFRNEILPFRRAILLTFEIYGANSPLHYVKHCVNRCFGNWITITLRHELRLKLFLNMQCNRFLSASKLLLNQFWKGGPRNF